jgi:hypothetical protein
VGSRLPQQLLVCIFVWFQCSSFPLCLSTTSCAHLVSISNSPIHWVSRIFACSLASPQLLAFILFQYLNFPPAHPQQLPPFIQFHIWFFPLSSPQFLTCILLQYLQRVSRP